MSSPRRGALCCRCCLQGLKEDLELLSGEKDNLQEVGEELVGLIGEADKPEVERSIEDVDVAVQALNDACDARQRALDDALRRATCFHDELSVSILSIGLDEIASTKKRPN